MEIALTGGTGFVGRHTARWLVERGHGVRLLARDRTRVPPELAEVVRIFAGDVTRPEQLAPFVAGATHVVHMAAVVGEGGVAAERYHAVHVTATRRLIEAAAAAGVRRFVHLSSVGVYGDTGARAADETCPARPEDAYERSKWQGEEEARAAAREHGVELVVLRPAGVYGRFDRRLLKLFRGIASGRFVLVGPCTCRYHLVHVEDVARAVELALVSASAAGEDFIVAGPEPVALSALITAIARIAGTRPPRLRLPLAPVALAARWMERLARPFGVRPPLYPERVAFFTKERAYSIDKARRLLGFEPAVDLETGLRRTLADYRADGWL
ncbi:MAG: NAD-dependent epimerase/dehydratase family protein [bacterium]